MYENTHLHQDHQENEENQERKDHRVRQELPVTEAALMVTNQGGIPEILGFSIPCMMVNLQRLELQLSMREKKLTSATYICLPNVPKTFLP